MPLSEHEKRQLEQIEQALRAGDPRFADAVRAADPRVHYRRRVIVAVLGFVIGVGLLLAGVVIDVILIAVAGFVVMLACSLWAVTSYRRMIGSAPGRAPAKDRGPGKKRHAARDRRAGKQAASRSHSPTAASTSASQGKPPSLVRRPPSKAATSGTPHAVENVRRDGIDSDMATSSGRLGHQHTKYPDDVALCLAPRPPYCIIRAS